MNHLTSFKFSRFRWLCVAAGILGVILYSIHFFYWVDSALFYIPYRYFKSDMYANLMMAHEIQKQGWLNPVPYHPYFPEIATVGEWNRWWGGVQVFQQSPLYVYILALFLHFSSNLIYVCAAQIALSFLLCVLIGCVTARITGNGYAGLAAFTAAMLYSPFYLYSCMLLRDLLGWAIAALASLILVHLFQSEVEKTRRANAFWSGVCLGVGYLAKESFMMMIPLTALAILWSFRKEKPSKSVACFLAGTAIFISPLIVRNYMVGAPLLSSSNRFAEAFIEGHAHTAHPYLLYRPRETREILVKTGGNALKTILETLKTQPSFSSWLSLQAQKALSLVDPFESGDNVNIYFVEQISPLVKWGLKYWMILVPGIAGAFLGLWKRDKVHLALWLVFIPLFANLFIGTPLSRYRQALATVLIPWGIYFFLHVTNALRARNQQGLWMSGAIVLGWILVIGPLSRTPKMFYDRQVEYRLSVDIYARLNQPERAKQMLNLVHKRFPGSP